MERQRYSVPIVELKECIDMLSGKAWTGTDIDVNAVSLALQRQDFEEKPWTVYEGRCPESQSGFRQQWDAAHESFHIRRIAYFVHHGIPTDDRDPIRMNVSDIQLGVGLKEQVEPYTLNIAGRHRLAAAIIRDDEKIEITFIGNQDVIKAMLPNAEPLSDTIITPDFIPR